MRSAGALGLWVIACAAPPTPQRAQPPEPAPAHSFAPPRALSPPKALPAPTSATRLDKARPNARTALSTEPAVLRAQVVLSGGEAAHVYAPPSSLPLPLLVVAHGAGGSPRAHCQFWSRVVAQRASVLCIPGRSMGSADAFYYENHRALAARVNEGLAALAGGAYANVDESRRIYIGYSQGATMGSLALDSIETAFAAVLLIEGGYQQWTIRSAERFRTRGGRIALLLCGTRACERAAPRTVRWLRQAGVEAWTEGSGQWGHAFGTPLQNLAERAIEQTLERLEGAD